MRPMKQGKEKKRKKREGQKDTTVPGTPNVASPSHEEEPTDNGRMDFGGLPNRDLKKNLGGCG